MINLSSDHRVLWKSSLRDLSTGPIRSYRWRASNQQPDSRTETFWVLNTNVRLSRFLECKQLELFLQGLPEHEASSVFDAPGVMSSRIFIDLLRAKSSLRSIQNQKDFVLQSTTLLQRLQGLQSMLGRTCWNENLLYTYLGNLKYEIALVRVPIRKVRKFSGWVRNASAVGSKRSSKLELLDTEIFESLLFEECDYYQFFISKELDFHFLGLDPGNLLYNLVMYHYDTKQELPENFKHLLLRKSL